MREYFLMGLVVFTTINAFAQTASFDVFTYQTPEFFTKNELPSGLQFAMNAVDGNFCTITLYKSRQAKEDAMKDISRQWKDQVVKRLAKASKKPGKIMTGQLLDGWASTLAIGNFYQNERKCVVMLNSFGKDQASACVVFAFSDPLFKSAVQNFSQNLHLTNQ
ncbi:MAG TPA: hypothetical protein VK666_28655 [Chryseolinea sp.]|nr:hypothetical protein [Chryseolinea sp.]